MEKMLSSYSLLQGYGKHIEKDFFIQFIGYDDFNKIEPLKIPHTQKMYTIHFVLSGSGRLFINGTEKHIKAHDIFFVPPDVTFCYYPDDDDKWTYLWFDFGGENALPYAEAAGFGDGAAVKRCAGSEEFFCAAMSVLRKMDKKQSVGYYEVMSLFYKLIALNAEEKHVNETDFADIASAYVRGHYYDGELSVEKICRHIGVSHSYMCRLFKEKTRMTLKHYIVNTRTDEAARLMETTDLSIKEIAFAVGFNDYPHFVKTFKKKKGISAGDYRKKLENNPDLGGVF